MEINSYILDISMHSGSTVSYMSSYSDCRDVTQPS